MRKPLAGEVGIGFQRGQHTQRNRGTDLFQKVYVDGTGAHGRVGNSGRSGQKGGRGPPTESAGREPVLAWAGSGALLRLCGGGARGRARRRSLGPTTARKARGQGEASCRCGWALLRTLLPPDPATGSTLSSRHLWPHERQRKVWENHPSLINQEAGPRAAGRFQPLAGAGCRVAPSRGGEARPSKKAGRSGRPQETGGFPKRAEPTP